jgi:hypothetical protein
MERIDEPLAVLAHKVFPSGAQLTKIKVAGQVAYVRENVGEGGQVLELSAPAESWAIVAAVVAVEDHLKRQIRNVDFSSWAETEFAR